MRFPIIILLLSLSLSAFAALASDLAPDLTADLVCETAQKNIQFKSSIWSIDDILETATLTIDGNHSQLSGRISPNIPTDQLAKAYTVVDLARHVYSSIIESSRYTIRIYAFPTTMLTSVSNNRTLTNFEALMDVYDNINFGRLYNKELYCSLISN